MKDAYEIARFSAVVARDMPVSMMIMGLPRVCPIDLAPVIAVAVNTVGVTKLDRFIQRIEKGYSKIAVGPRMPQAPRKFV